MLVYNKYVQQWAKIENIMKLKRNHSLFSPPLQYVFIIRTGGYTNTL